MNPCHHCGSTALVKAGHNASGRQRYQCKACKRHSTLEPSSYGYAPEIRQRAIQMSLEGNGLRRIGRFLNVTHQTVANWLEAYQTQLPEAPHPAQAETIELDELYTFVQTKKPSLSHNGGGSGHAWHRELGFVVSSAERTC